MVKTLTTKIDDRYRPGALNGLVEPGQRYEVERISDTELRFRRLVVSERAPARIIREGKRTRLVSDRVLTREEVARELEEFP